MTENDLPPEKPIADDTARPLSPKPAAEQLLPTTSIPWFHTGAMTGCLDTLDRIVENTPCFNLYFLPDRDITDIISVLF